MEMQQLAMYTRQQGQENNPVFNQLHGSHNYPSQETTHRWSVREQGEGHYRQALHNYEPSDVLVGEMRFKLVMYRILFPKATSAELNCYLYNATFPGQEQRFYSGSQICCAEDDCRTDSKARLHNCEASQSTTQH
jgi:hypothetical protein